MFFIFKRGQEEFNGLSMFLQQGSTGSYIHLFSVFSECPAYSPTLSGSTDLGYASLYIIKSVFTVLSLLGTYIITSPAIPMIITTNVSNQAFSWTVEIKARDTHQPLSKYQSLCLGALSFQISMSFVSMSFQISRFCWMSGHSTEEGYKCILLQYNSLVGKILKKQTIEMWVVSLY